MKSMTKLVFTLAAVLISGMMLSSVRADASEGTSRARILMEDAEPIAKKSHKFVDLDGEVIITVEWLRRPGEFAVNIDYWGYLTQEGNVNCYLDINGTRREFITLQENKKNRRQRIRILSFHPTVERGESRGLKPLNPDEMVDYLLFRNTPYYPQFGNVNIEMKFFANGRWDGDGNNYNENYKISFDCPVTDSFPDHF